MAKPSYLPDEVTTYWDPDEGRVVQPAGTILQIQYTQYDTIFSQSLTADTDTALNNLTVNITPSSTTSIILLQTHMFFEFGLDNNIWDHTWFFYRNSTKLASTAASPGARNIGISMATRTYSTNDDNSTPEIARYDYFDQPNTTDQITYKVGINVNISETIQINATVGDATNTFQYERGVSFISATEIAG